MTLVFCHCVDDTLIIVTDSLISGHNAQKPKCASFSAKRVVITWWGDHNLEPKVLAENPCAVQPGDMAFARNNSIADKLLMPEDVLPCFPTAFLTALNQTEHVHNGDRGTGGLLMGVAVQKRIYAFVYEVRGGKGSWQLADTSGVRVWPQVFGDTDSLAEMLKAQIPKEDASALSGTRTIDEFTIMAKRWIMQTEQFQKDQKRVVSVGLPAYGILLRGDGTIKGPEVV